MDFKYEIAKAIAQCFELDINEVYSAIEIPPDKKMGDYAFLALSLLKF